MRFLKIIPDVISCLFILLFTYAALSKLLDFQKFLVQLGKSPFLTDFSFLIGLFIPALEIVLALCFLFKRTQLFALYTSFSLMVVFTVYIVAILKFSPYVPCSCGGILEHLSWLQHLVFNIGFVLLGIIGIQLYPSQKS